MSKKKRSGKSNSFGRFFKENYSKSWSFLKGTRNFIWIILGIFILFVLIGFFAPAPPNVVEYIMQIIEEILEITRDMTTGELINFIFWNNLKVSLMGMIAGILFGILPILEAIVNGYLLGFVASHAVMVDGYTSLWRIFPHGIFELPAVFISLALGLRLGVYFFHKKQKKLMSFKQTLVESFKLFIFVVIPLLIIAAVIEGLLIAFL